jgi:16S rRNA (cytosine1402-N4)-methyltransferase
VLCAEVLDALAPSPGQTYLDATAGLGGHAALVAPRLQPGGRVILNDADPANLERATARVREAAGAGADVLQVDSITGNFAFLPRLLIGSGRSADLVLADLGFSSNQMDDGARGFSFMRDGPLDMRLDPALRSTAADLVNGLPERELARILSELGDERHAARIAQKLAQARQQGPISSTGQLAELVRSVLPGSHTGIDPATRTFQALRIAVNDELGSLESFASDVVREAEAVFEGARDGVSGASGSWLSPGAKVAFISFHSLEDRIVKSMVAKVVGCGGKDLLNGTVTPGEAEQASNPRSRSAKLRCVQLPLVSKRAARRDRELR